MLRGTKRGTGDGLVSKIFILGAHNWGNREKMCSAECPGTPFWASSAAGTPFWASSAALLRISSVHIFSPLLKGTVSLLCKIHKMAQSSRRLESKTFGKVLKNRFISFRLQHNSTSVFGFIFFLEISPV